jgi:hypothetical protein
MTTKVVQLNIETTVTYYFTCPNCVSKVHHDVTRRVEDNSNFDRELGPWICRECQHQIYITLRPKTDASGTHVFIETRVVPIALGEQLTEGLVLLESNTKDENGHIYLIVHSDYVGKQRTPEDESSLFYHYDEGSCPTNWSKHIIAFVHQSDADPHGVFSYVKHLKRDEIEAKFKEHNLAMPELGMRMFNNNNFSQLLFPEIFTDPQSPRSWG